MLLHMTSRLSTGYMLWHMTSHLSTGYMLLCMASRVSLAHIRKISLSTCELQIVFIRPSLKIYLFAVLLPINFSLGRR